MDMSKKRTSSLAPRRDKSLRRRHAAGWLPRTKKGAAPHSLPGALSLPAPAIKRVVVASLRSWQGALLQRCSPATDDVAQRGVAHSQ